MGILQRYVFGEVVRSFGLALLTMTAIFVLFMVAAQAQGYWSLARGHRPSGALRYSEHAAVHDSGVAAVCGDGCLWPAGR